MDFDHLRTYIEAVRRGSFSEAARSLSLSQPAVSRRIRNLERELGLELLSRSGGVFTPTREGLEFMKFAEDVTKRLELFRQAAGGKRSVCGILQIAASSTPGEFLLPNLLAGFLKSFPDVKTSLNTMDSDTVETCVREGHCDVGFLGRPVERALEAYPIARDEVVLAVWPSHPFARRGRALLDELADERFIERREGSGTHHTVLRLLQESGRTLPHRRVVMEVSSIRAQVAAIQMEQGIGFISSLALEAYGRSRVAAVRIDDLPLVRMLYMIYDPDHKGPALIEFTRYVRTLSKARSLNVS